jgi:hypothetical protein
MMMMLIIIMRGYNKSDRAYIHNMVDCVKMCANLLCILKQSQLFTGDLIMGSSKSTNWYGQKRREMR